MLKYLHINKYMLIFTEQLKYNYMSKKLTKIEKETLLRVLSSVIDCFQGADLNEDTNEFEDGGNFICSLTQEQIYALNSAYYKL